MTAVVVVLVFVVVAAVALVVVDCPWLSLGVVSVSDDVAAACAHCCCCCNCFRLHFILKLSPTKVKIFCATLEKIYAPHEYLTMCGTCNIHDMPTGGGVEGGGQGGAKRATRADAVVEFGMMRRRLQIVFARANYATRPTRCIQFKSRLTWPVFIFIDVC